jgi:hypothetical protein
LNRVRLRDNWPLCLACLLSLLAVAYLIFFLASPLRYPFEGTIIYPFLSIYQATTGYLFCFSSLFFVLALGWACRAIRDRQFTWIVVVGWVSAGLICFAYAPIGIFGLFVTLILILVQSFRQKAKRALTLLLAIIAISCLFLPTLARLFFNIEYRDRVLFEDRLYRLMVLKTSDEYCENNYFIVYQCDSYGLICNTTFKSRSYDVCSVSYLESEALEASIDVDTSQRRVFFEINGERFPANP